MLKKGLIAAIPLALALAGCKSERPFERERYPANQPGMGTDGRSGTDGRGTDHGWQGQQGQQGQPQGQPQQGGTMGGPMGGTDGMMGREERYRQEVPRSIKNLEGSVEKIRTASDMQHSEFVSALRNLADSIEALPNATTTNQDYSSRIRSYADRIEASGTTSNMHARWGKRALKEGADALEKYGTAENITGFKDQVKGVNTEIDKIVDDKPFMDQKAQFADAVQQMADVLAYASVPRPVEGTK